MDRGIDVSNWQGAVDWPRVAQAGIRFAWIKTSEGVNYVDPWFNRNASGAQTAGVPWGGYHFARPDGGHADPQREAAWAVQAGIARGPLPPVLDLETSALSAGATDDWALAWLAEVERLSGRRPVVYVGAYFPMEPNSDLAVYDLWLPSYPSGAENPNPDLLPRPVVPPAWRQAGRTWQVWQFTSKGRIPGVAGWCDVNVARDGWLAGVLGTDLEDDMTDDDFARIEQMVQREMTNQDGRMAAALGVVTARIVASCQDGVDPAEVARQVVAELGRELAD